MDKTPAIPSRSPKGTWRTYTTASARFNSGWRCNRLKLDKLLALVECNAELFEEVVASQQVERRGELIRKHNDRFKRYITYLKDNLVPVSQYVPTYAE
ncbi:MAG: hypothetical protein HYW07_16215 [Candidatus Latescibacteria bacterium]|nr:hypothetical protein [Candidatus Latescibacterota bacterium]